MQMHGYMVAWWAFSWTSTTGLRPIFAAILTSAQTVLDSGHARALSYLSIRRSDHLAIVASCSSPSP